MLTNLLNCSYSGFYAFSKNRSIAPVETANFLGFHMQFEIYFQTREHVEYAAPGRQERKTSVLLVTFSLVHSK